MELILPQSRAPEIIVAQLPRLLTPDTVSSLHNLVRQISPFQTLLLQGEDPDESFCQGMDLDQFASLSTDKLRAGLARYAEILQLIYEGTFISVAKVESLAIGGGLALAAACDSVIATENARFGLPEAIYGFPPAIVSVILQQRCHARTVRAMSLNCDSISTTEALSIGIVDIGCEQEQLEKKLRYEIKRLHRASIAGRIAVKQLQQQNVKLKENLQSAVDTTFNYWSSPEVRASIEDLKAEAS